MNRLSLFDKRRDDLVNPLQFCRRYSKTLPRFAANGFIFFLSKFCFIKMALQFAGLALLAAIDFPVLQKTYIDDCINKKVKKNTGQLPMYLVQNHHEGIISRETFDAAQAELSRRNAGRSPSKKNAPTGRSRYSSKYALSDRLVRYKIPALHLAQPRRQQAHRLALCQPGRLRQQVLPRLTNAG